MGGQPGRPPGPASVPGAAEVLRSVEDEARSEVQAMLAEADAAAATIVAQARRSVEARVAQARDAADVAARTEAARMVNEVRLRLVHRRAELAARRVDEVFAAAERRLEAIASGPDRARWARALHALAREAADHAGPGAVIEVRGQDVELLAGPAPGEPGTAADPAGARIRGTLDEAGLRLVAADGHEVVDATLATRLSRARAALAAEVASTLGLEPRD